MNHLTRRSALLAVPAGTAALAASGASAAATPNAPNLITFTARRTKVTLPNVPAVVPALGTTFVGYLSLDKDGTIIGDGSINGAVVDIIAGLPPRLVTQVNAIFRLAGGEIHTSNMHLRVIPNPGIRHPIAVTGGTFDYRTARGGGTIEHINDTDTAVVLNVLVDPPPPGTA